MAWVANGNWLRPGAYTFPPSIRTRADDVVLLGWATVRVPRYVTVWPDSRADAPGASRNWRLTLNDALAAKATATTTRPMCTTMPPLARPVTARHRGVPWRRAARTDTASW